MPGRGPSRRECVGDVAIAFQAARLQLLRSRVDLEVASAAGFSPYDTARVVARWPLSGSTDRWPAAHRPAQRRPDAPGGDRRTAGPLAQALILDEPLAGSGCRQPAGPAAAADGPAPEQRSDGHRHLARLRRAGRAMPAHPASGQRDAAVGPPTTGDVMSAAASTPPGGAAAPGARNVGHPRTVGRHEIHCGLRHFAVLSFYPGWIAIG